MTLALLSGVLIGLSMPGFPLHPAVWISLVPLIFSLEKGKHLSNGLKFSLAFATSLAISHFWLLDTITTNFPRFANFSPFQGFLVFLLFLLYESLFFFPLTCPFFVYINSSAISFFMFLGTWVTEIPTASAMPCCVISTGYS